MATPPGAATAAGCPSTRGGAGGSDSGSSSPDPVSLVLVEQPDGDLVVGTDDSKPRPARKKQQPTPPTPHAGGDASLAAQQAAAAAAASAAATRALVAERQAKADAYEKTALRRRKAAFLSLLVSDMLFFVAALALILSHRQQQPAQQQPAAADAASQALQGAPGAAAAAAGAGDAEGAGGRGCLPLGGVKLDWWLNPGDLRREDSIFSIAVDLLGLVAGVQNRTAMLALYCVVQVLSTTALSTMVGSAPIISLFTLYRLALLLLAFCLRTAILTHAAMLEAVRAAAGPPRWGPGAAARLGLGLRYPAGGLWSRLLGSAFSRLGGVGSGGGSRRGVLTGRGAQDELPRVAADVRPQAAAAAAQHAGPAQRPASTSTADAAAAPPVGGRQTEGSTGSSAAPLPGLQLVVLPSEAQRAPGSTQLDEPPGPRQ